MYQFIKRYQFNFQWSMFIIAFLAVAILMSLTFWQINRAKVKQSILEQQSFYQQKKAYFWTDYTKLPQAFEKIIVKGKILPIIFLLDNQYSDHKLGYQVISPLLLSNKQVVLIDRGWIKASVNRNDIPKIVTPISLNLLKGTVYYPSDKLWVLGNVIEKNQLGTVVIEKIDPLILAKVLHKLVYPFIIRLDKSEIGGFKRYWTVVAMPPSRHYAYALQWFVMGIIVILLFIGLNMKKKI